MTSDPQEHVAKKVYGNIKRFSRLDIIRLSPMFTTFKNGIKSSHDSVKNQDICFKFSITTDPAKILGNPIKKYIFSIWLVFA